MNRHVLRYIILTLALTCLQAVRAQVLISPLPEKDGPHTSDLYSVRVRPSSGGDWQTVPVLRCDVNTRRRQQSAFAEFDMGEPIQVQVVRRNASLIYFAPDVPDSCILPSRVEGMKEHPVGRYTLERVSHTEIQRN